MKLRLPANRHDRVALVINATGLACLAILVATNPFPGAPLVGMGISVAAQGAAAAVTWRGITRRHQRRILEQRMASGIALGEPADAAEVEADRPVPVDPDRPCPHLRFQADVAVNRIGVAETADGLPKAYMADITVHCSDCDEPFRWVGVPAGLNYAHPMVSPDETEMRAPLRPASSDPDFGLGIPGFAIRYSKGDS